MMQKFIDWSCKNPVQALLAFLLAVLVGAVILGNLMV